MNALPLAGGIALGFALLVGCSTTNKTPDEADSGPDSGAAPVAVAPAQPSAAGASAAAAPLEREKVDVLIAEGFFEYVATGGRSPFESIQCRISWSAGGEDAKASVGVKAREGRFKDVKMSAVLGAEALRNSFSSFLQFDPMKLAEQQPRSSATDLHTYTLEQQIGGETRTVTGYGLLDGSDFETLIRGMDDICATSEAINQSRSAE